MNISRSLVAVALGCVLLSGVLNGVAGAPAAQAVEPTVGQQTRDICPPAENPGDPGTGTTNPDGVLDSATFSGPADARKVHVTAHGLGTGFVNAVSWHAFCAGLPDSFISAPIDSDGAASLDMPVVGGRVNYFHLDTNKGTLDFFADDSGTNPVDPKPGKPIVTASASVSGRSTLDIRGTDTADVTVRDTDGRAIAGGRLVAGATRISVPTPSAERHYSVTQTVDDAESDAADVVLTAGTGTAVPAAPITTSRAGSAPGSVILTVRGEPNALVRVHSHRGDVIGIKSLRPDGTAEAGPVAQSDIRSDGQGASGYVTQTSDGATSAHGAIQ